MYYTNKIYWYRTITTIAQIKALTTKIALVVFVFFFGFMVHDTSSIHKHDGKYNNHEGNFAIAIHAIF